MWIVFTNIYDVFGILFCLEVYWTKTFSKQKMSRFFVSLQAVPGWNEVKFQAPGETVTLDAMIWNQQPIDFRNKTLEWMPLDVPKAAIVVTKLWNPTVRAC